MKNHSPGKGVSPRDQIHADVDDTGDAVIGRALRWSLLVALAVATVAGACLFWFVRTAPPILSERKPIDLPEHRELQLADLPHVPFTDVTGESGITFVHTNGAYGDKLLPETLGGGCAFFDFDNDGDQDLLLVNSCRWPWDPQQSSTPLTATHILYRNDGTGHFTDVTALVGLGITSYGMGVAVGDYDNDGFVDIFLSNVGVNTLLRNTNGRFEDVTDEAGVAGDDEAWSTSCAWLDYDKDGDLDLFVCNYVRWSREIDMAQGFQLVGVGRAYGPPTAFQGTFPYLYRNDGEGRFIDASAEAGIEQTNLATGVPLAKSLGVVPVDVNDDGWIDVIVGNDTVRNFLFVNQQDGTFKEVGIPAGVAFDATGKARGAMGIDAAPFRNDTSLGVVIGNFAHEMTAFYVASDGECLFTDDAIPTGVGPPTRLELSFGLFFFDYDLDGRLDLLTANGHLENDINRVQRSQHYRQPARLFWNAGDDQVTEFVSATQDRCGPDLFTPLVGRGATYADIDGDGDLDVLLTQIEGQPLLLRNDQQLNHDYVRLKLVGRHSNRDAIGAWVELRMGNRIILRQVMPTRSYLSQVELPVTLGLGTHGLDGRLFIRWPDGSQQEVLDCQINRTTIVEQVDR